jgi:integrase
MGGAAWCVARFLSIAITKAAVTRVYVGVYGTPDSHKRYTQEIAKWQSRQDEPASDLTVSHLDISYIEHARASYRKGGVETTEVKCIRLALKLLLRRYRNCPVDQFDTLKLERVRDAMIAAKWVRVSINRHVGRIRRMFNWGVKRKLVPRGAYIDVCTLEPLDAERSRAVESEPVEAVSDAVVDAVLCHVSRPVRGLLQFMQHTGARPGEALIVRACDINMSEKVWEYRPARHKTQHHKKQRVVMIGPAAQKLLKPFHKSDLKAFVFDPPRRHRGRRQPLP